MSHIDPGPLATYESLADPHLTGYFNNSRMRKHLKRMGLITSRGEIVSEKVFRLNNARKEHQRHVRDVLAQAIVHKALDMERHRQMHIKHQLEEIGKIERVRRVRAERALRGDEDILPLLSPTVKQGKKGKKGGKKEKVPILQTVADSEDYEQRPPQSVGYPALPAGPPYNTRAERMTTQYPNVEVDNQHLYNMDRDALRSFTLNLSQFDLGSGVSPYSVPAPPTEGAVTKKKSKRRPATATGMPRRPRAQRPRSNARSLRLHRREPPMMHRAQIHSLARVTFKYLGQMVHLDHEEEDPRDEVVVMQQHCGGENLRIFKKMLMKGDTFVVISRRHRTFPFSLTFYLNGVQVERLSTCCEYKHKTGHKLGAKSSHFGIIRVEGSQPCFKCLISQGKLKTRPDPTPPPSGRTKPSLPRKKRDKKPQGVDDKKTDEYEDDFQGSSKSSTTTEDVQTDGPKAPSEVSSSEVSSDSSSLTSEGESESEDESSDDESKLPSLKPEDDDDSSTLSDDSQKDVNRSKSKKYAAKQERIKSPPTSGKKSRSSAGRQRIKSPPKDRVKSPPSDRVKSPVPKSKRDPVPVRAEARSPPPAIQKVEKTSSSESSAKEEAKDSSSRASTSVSSMSDAQDTVEEVPLDVAPKKDDKPKKAEDTSPVAEVTEISDKKPSTQGTLTKPVEIPERPPTPEPESESSSSDSESTTSDAESVKSKHSDKAESKPQKVTEIHSNSIMPLVKSRVNVDISNRQLTDGQAKELVRYFQMDFDSQRVQALNVSGCKIGDQSGKQLFQAMSKLKSLRKLEIMENGLSGDSVEDILNVCQKNPVEELNFANNPLNDGGCEQLLSGFTKSQATVVTAKIQKKVSQTLIASVLKDTKKEMADEIGTSVSSTSSMSSFASSAMSETMFILKKLDISHTKANHASFVCLGQYLSLNPKLESLNISGNTISTTALEALLKPLSDGSNKKLKSLIMNETTMDDRHATLLVEMLKGKSSLEELSIKGNRITAEGLENVKQLKDMNDSLKQLKTD